jgi:hypothetical protein
MKAFVSTENEPKLSDSRAVEIAGIWAAGGDRVVTFCAESWTDPASWEIMLEDSVEAYCRRMKSLTRAVEATASLLSNLQLMLNGDHRQTIKTRNHNAYQDVDEAVRKGARWRNTFLMEEN